MARYPQIKALIWYPYQDMGPADPPPNNGGCYSGLVTTTGAFKLSWYAFSGGNKLTLKAARLSRTSRRLSGVLSSAALGGLRGKTVVLYSKKVGHPWRVARSLTTGTKGSWHWTVKLTAAKTWFKVAWVGVTRSAILTVKR